MKTTLSRSFAKILCALLLALPCSSRAADTLLQFFDIWLYADNGVDQGTAWRNPGFPAPDFQVGMAEFGFGDGDEFTGLNSAPGGTPLNTAYFITLIDVPDPSIYENLSLFYKRDDGAIVYLNGVEVFRNNMPTGAVNYATKALRNIDGDEEFAILNRAIPASLLVAGNNTIAVEVHQAVGGDDDMSFALGILGHLAIENQPPSAPSSHVITEQDLSTNITLNATDPDGDPLAFSIVTSPQHGTLSGTAPNVTYHPAPGYVGPDSFTFMATDGEWNTEIAEVTIDVQLVSNQPPTANSQNVTVAEDNPLLITLTATDPDGDVLTYTPANPAQGTLTPAGGATFLYQPAANYFGPDSFTFTVDDGNGGIATGTVSITVTSVNDSPTALALVAAASDPTNFVKNLAVFALNNQNALVLFQGIGSDVEGDSLSYAWYKGENLTPFSTLADPCVTLWAGNHTITLMVSDGVATVSDTVTVQVFTPCDLISSLANAVIAADVKQSEENHLLGFLNAACAEFGAGNIAAALNDLEWFQTRVDRKISPGDPTLGAALIAQAQDIIDLVTEEWKPAPSKRRSRK